MSGRRHRTRRERNRLAKSKPFTVLKCYDHPTLKPPFFVFSYGGRGHLRVEVLESGEIKLHTFGMSRTGSRFTELALEEWPDPVCVYMAKRALTEGA